MTRKVPTENDISDRDIKIIAKNYGFEPQIQPDGTVDLDPDIYLFARAMIKEFEQVEAMKRSKLTKDFIHVSEQLKIARIKIESME